MTNGDKARAIARMFDEGRPAAAFMAMEWMMQEREWPDWLKDVCADVDALTKEKDHG